MFRTYTDGDHARSTGRDEGVLVEGKQSSRVWDPARSVPPIARPLSCPPHPVQVRNARLSEYPSRVAQQWEEMIKQDIQDNFGAHIRRDYPVIDFVRQVWGLGPTSIPRLPDGAAYTLSAKFLTAYSNAVGDESITPLVMLLQDLLKQLFLDSPLCGGFGADIPLQRAVDARFVNIADRPDAEDGEFRLFGPDIGWGTLAGIDRQVWSWYLAYVGAQKCNTIRMTPETDLRIRLEALSSAQFGATIKQPSVPLNSNSLTEEEIRAARHFDCMMHGSPRSYASGFSVNDTTMTLWYADRIGLVSSVGFDLVEQAHLLLVVLAAMGSADIYQMGLCPYLHFPPGFSRLGGTTLVLPEGEAIDVAGKRLGQLVFTIDNAKRMYSKREPIGRGTTVFHVRAKGNAQIPCTSERLIAKMAWISPGRNAEDGYIRVIRRKLRENGAGQYLKHIVDLKCSVERTMREMKLPRAFMDDVREDNTERIFRLLVLKEYEELERVLCPEEFKTIYIDALHAHHWAWKIAGVLHCDISVGNIMFYRDGARVVGVLCDWDLARFQSPDPEAASHYKRRFNDVYNQRGVPKYDSCRYGTVPFMAHELLSPFEKHPHEYAHDLESFYYLLVWFCVVFDPVEHRCRSMPEWEDGDEKTLWTNKRRFLSDSGVYSYVIADVHPDYAQLVWHWMDGLSHLFRSVFNNRAEAKWLPGQINYARASGDIVEVRNLMARKKALEAEGASVTYEEFLAAIGVDEYV